jgi:nitrite reductase/ring-hydroxylating ferredoxin subunit
VGCLVCPWHASTYAVRTGELVPGPRGFLLYRGPTPGYSALVKAFAATVKLRVRRALRRGDDVVVEEA